jgi:hypothetical protein
LALTAGAAKDKLPHCTGLHGVSHEDHCRLMGCKPLAVNLKEHSEEVFHVEDTCTSAACQNVNALP